MEIKAMNRRSFVAGSSAFTVGLAWTASSYARVVGSNERILIGLIGCGGRGSALRYEVLQHSEAANARVAAVCDIWDANRQAAAQHVEDLQGEAPKQFEDYREVLALEGLQAVVIATPDHQHPIMLRDAARAKLDAYVEKPLAIDFDDLCEACDAVKENGTIVQNGTQLRSLASFTGCREFIGAGRLGTILRLEQARNEYYPYWHQYRREIKPENTNWEAFLMNAKPQPWSEEVYTAWMGYRPFSNGAFGGYMTHFTDLVHYITGVTPPQSAVATSWKNQFDEPFTVPSSVQAVFDYPGGFSVSYHTTTGNGGANYFRAIGSKGILDMSDWGNPVASGEGSQDAGALGEKTPVAPIARDEHMLNFLKCIRSREQPNADIEAGFNQALTAILADEAMLQGRKVCFDAEQRRLVTA
jgi:predicted dehydrogenase